jgi:excisionase family DNA binding protein
MELLTVKEVAKMFRVDDTTVRRWARNACIQAVRLPSGNKRQSYRIRKDTVEAFLNSGSRVE